MKQMLRFIWPRVKDEKAVLPEDNSGAIHPANNPTGSARSKYINVRHRLICDVVRKGNISIKHVGSRLQHANVLTTDLSSEAYRRHRRHLINLTLDERGCQWR